jgi:hypothetical protein
LKYVVVRIGSSYQVQQYGWPLSQIVLDESNHTCSGIGPHCVLEFLRFELVQMLE